MAKLTSFAVDDRNFLIVPSSFHDDYIRKVTFEQNGITLIIDCPHNKQQFTVRLHCCCGYQFGPCGSWANEIRDVQWKKLQSTDSTVLSLRAVLAAALRNRALYAFELVAGARSLTAYCEDMVIQETAVDDWRFDANHLAKYTSVSRPIDTGMLPIFRGGAVASLTFYAQGDASQYDEVYVLIGLQPTNGHVYELLVQTNSAFTAALSANSQIDEVSNISNNAIEILSQDTLRGVYLTDTERYFTQLRQQFSTGQSSLLTIKGSHGLFIQAICRDMIQMRPA